MSIRQRLEQDIKTAMKSGDKLRLGCLRMLKSKMIEREVELRTEAGKGELDDDVAATVVAAYAKQRRDSIESYRGASRQDLVEKEQAELAIVTEYLPRQLSDDEIRKVVGEAIAESGAVTIKDLGQVMKLVVPRTKGLADGKKVNQVVRELLGAG